MHNIKNVDHVCKVLRIVFGFVPIIVGFDKLFFNFIVDWVAYLNPMIPSGFMVVVALAEIIAGALVLYPKTTKIGAYVVAVWLILIAVNLITINDFDTALRDIGLAAGAYALAKLTK